MLADGALSVETIPREALCLAGKAFLRHRKQQGTKTNVLPDFFIGAHAAATASRILTRDVERPDGESPGPLNHGLRGAFQSGRAHHATSHNVY